MNSHHINIFEFPSNLGLKKKESDSEPGVRFLPDWLRKHQLYTQLNPRQIFTLPPPPYGMNLDEASGVRNATQILDYAKKQAGLLLSEKASDCFQLMIGGDCSILIGNALALKQQGKYGLFFLDGHTDFMMPDFSQTGGAAGMDLAIITGHGHPKLTNILNLQPYFDEKNVWCVGNREYDRDYVKPILESEITYVDLQKVRSVGMAQCTGQFLEMVENHQLDEFFIHLDVDVLNDRIMPAVDSRQPDGLEYEELTHLLENLLASPKAIGLEITILDPSLDKVGVYTTELITNLVKAINAGRKATLAS